ncbi:MAG TPA: hypothetical protein VFY16_11465 [Gemmatimonadaceae bacterium]|nr:hypothetical protein [Gemmatimonadaceae bacterium]
MCVSVVAVLAAGMLLTPAAGAQAPVAADVCTTLAPSADSADVVVHLVLDRWRLPGMASPQHSPGERAALALILQEFRQGLVFPLPLSFRPSLASGFMDVSAHGGASGATRC